jgi:hypothetical protein
VRRSRAERRRPPTAPNAAERINDRGGRREPDVVASLEATARARSPSRGPAHRAELAAGFIT